MSVARPMVIRAVHRMSRVRKSEGRPSIEAQARSASDMGLRPRCGFVCGGGVTRIAWEVGLFADAGTDRDSVRV